MKVFQHPPPDEGFWALKDVSFDVEQGGLSASREFPHVDDAALGIILATEHYNKSDPVNLGSGTEITIRDLLNLIQELTGFVGEIHWDTSKPDGQPKRSLDVSGGTKRVWV